jgi:hypothetical protein
MPSNMFSDGSFCPTGAPYAAATSSYFDGKLQLWELSRIGTAAIREGSMI